MPDAETPVSAEAPIEVLLRDELARADDVIGTIGPVLGHLIANHHHALFSDEIVARVRGMIGSLARQLLEIQAAIADEADPHAFALDNHGDLAGTLAACPPLLLHCHSLALESQLAERLHLLHAIDPVLSPLLQSLVASDDPGRAALGMQALASQARFMQRQKRMQLPLAELPADLLHRMLTIWRESADKADPARSEQVEARIRRDFDESSSRLGLLSRLVAEMGCGAHAALSISHAGVAMFLTALSAASGQERDIVALSTNDRLAVRLALALRGAGLDPQLVEEQCFYLQPEAALPDGFARLPTGRARELLAATGGWRRQ